MFKLKKKMHKKNKIKKMTFGRSRYKLYFRQQFSFYMNSHKRNWDVRFVLGASEFIDIRHRLNKQHNSRVSINSNRSTPNCIIVHYVFFLLLPLIRCVCRLLLAMRSMFAYGGNWPFSKNVQELHIRCVFVQSEIKCY